MRGGSRWSEDVDVEKGVVLVDGEMTDWGKSQSAERESGGGAGGGGVAPSSSSSSSSCEEGGRQRR